MHAPRKRTSATPRQSDARTHATQRRRRASEHVFSAHKSTVHTNSPLSPRQRAAHSSQPTTGTTSWICYLASWRASSRSSKHPPSESHPGQITAAPVALHSRHCCCYAYYCLLTSPKWLRRGPGDNADSPTSPQSARGHAKGESSQRAATQYRTWPTGQLSS